MSSNSAFHDYKIFIKKNLKTIVGTMVITLIVLLSAALFYATKTEEEVVVDDEYVVEQILPQIDNSADVEQLSSSDQEVLTDYLNKQSYSFRIYVENEDNTVFTDNELLKQVLLENDLVQAIAEQTDSEFIPTKDLAVSVFTVRGSEMIQVKVGTGNPEYNQRIANYYYDFIENGNLTLLDDKNIYFVDSEPIAFEEIYGITEEDQEVEESFQQKVVTYLEIIIIVSLLGVLGGLILGTFISIIKESLNKKIPSIYNFDLFSTNAVVNLDSIPDDSVDDETALIVQSITAENKNNKLILSEKPLDAYLKEQITETASTSNKQYYVDIANMENINLENVEEIVILVQTYGTSKKWFEKQMEQVKALALPVKVIRLPIDDVFFSED